MKLKQYQPNLEEVRAISNAGWVLKNMARQLEGSDKKRLRSVMARLNTIEAQIDKNWAKILRKHRREQTRNRLNPWWSR